jgi:hypothetical protein
MASGEQIRTDMIINYMDIITSKQYLNASNH